MSALVEALHGVFNRLFFSIHPTISSREVIPSLQRRLRAEAGPSIIEIDAGCRPYWNSYRYFKMKALRFLFLAACVGCLAIVARNGRWESRVTSGNMTWILDLGRAPIWAPPEESSYARFRAQFPDFPRHLTLDSAAKAPAVLKLGWMIGDLCIYLWPVTILGGLFYLLLRKQRVDSVLHIGLCAGVALTFGGFACLALWLIFGGWGPPMPEYFGSASLILGTLVGWADYNRLTQRDNSDGRRSISL